jgi:SAM-dependent methyltransferase
LLDSRELLGQFLQWDVRTWTAALRMWHPVVSKLSGARVLDVGARDGGLSLYFALMGQRVVCSDLHGPSEAARELHRRYEVADRVGYAAVDATRIAFPDNTFDLVCFKSVLGGIGASGIDFQRQAVREMHRVLRPGGHLLFAENLQGCWLHRFLRRHFIKWAERWRYVTLAEMDEFLIPFLQVRSDCHGILATLGRNERQRSALSALDWLLEPILPARTNYMIAGIAEKG